MNMDGHSNVYVGISRDNQNIIVHCSLTEEKPVYLSRLEYESFIWPGENWAEVQTRILNTARFIGWMP